jgi:hypothetical protein
MDSYAFQGKYSTHLLYIFFLEIYIFKKYLITFLLPINKLNFTYAQKAIHISAIYTLPYALVPFYLYDDIIKHLYVPKYVL